MGQPLPGSAEEWERWLNGLHDLEPARQDYAALEHALMVHMGVKEDDTGFDLSKFEKKPPEPKPVAIQSKKPEPKPAEDDDLGGCDPEFLADLDRCQAEGGL